MPSINDQLINYKKKIRNLTPFFSPWTALVYSKAKKFVLKITAREQSVIKARLKFLSPDVNNFFVKSIYKCVMDNESYFTVEGNEWQQHSYYDSENHPAKENVKFIRNPVFYNDSAPWMPFKKASNDAAVKNIIKTKKNLLPDILIYFDENSLN
jgi:hypothetical protein